MITLVITLSGCGVMPGSGNVDASDPVKTVDGEKAAITTASATPTQSSTTSTNAPVARTEVVWADYDQGTQADIDLMTSNGDCLGIQSFFGMATATEDAVKARTGHGNEALTAYLNEALQIAKCN